VHIPIEIDHLQNSKFGEFVVEHLKRNRGKSPIDAKASVTSKTLMTIVALCCFSYWAKVQNRDSDRNSPPRDLTFYNSIPANFSPTAISAQSKENQFSIIQTSRRGSETLGL